MKRTVTIVDRIIFFLYGCLFFLTPLIVYHKTSELFEFNKMIFIYFITASILFIWLTKMIIYKKIILKRTFLDVPLLLFFITQLISTLFSIDKHTSFFGYYGRFNGGLLSLFSYLILFYAFVSTISKVSDVFKLLQFSLLSSLAVILIGLPGRVGYDFLCWIFTRTLNNSCWTVQFQPAIRMFSTLGQPNWLGAYLVIHFFIGFYFFMKSYGKRRLLMIVYAGYLFLNFAALLFTRSRSALLAMGIGVIVLLIYIIFAKKKLIRPTLYFILSLGILLFIFKTGIEKIDKYISFLHGRAPVVSSRVESSAITDSADIRKIVWKGAWDLAVRYPWLGTGVETFAYSYYFTRPLSHNQTSEWDFIYNKAHNEYLNYLATTGFIGLGAYLILIFSFVWNMIKKLKIADSLQTILFISWMTILITNFFGFSTSTINLFFFLIPALIIILIQPYDQNKTLKIISLSWRQKSGFLMNFFIFILLVIFLATYFAADIFYAQAQEKAREDQYDEAVSLLDRSLNMHYEHVYQDKLSSYLATEAYLTSYQRENTITQKLMVRADQYNRLSLRASYDNMLYWRTKAKNYFLFYQMTSAKKYFYESI